MLAPRGPSVVEYGRGQRVMPANLTPEYKRAEERFRTARSPQEKLEALEEMLRVIPKHKGTAGRQVAGGGASRLAASRPPKTGVILTLCVLRDLRGSIRP